MLLSTYNRSKADSLAMRLSALLNFNFSFNFNLNLNPRSIWNTLDTSIAERVIQRGAIRFHLPKVLCSTARKYAVAAQSSSLSLPSFVIDYGVYDPTLDLAVSPISIEDIICRPAYTCEQFLYLTVFPPQLEPVNFF